MKSVCSVYVLTPIYTDRALSGNCNAVARYQYGENQSFILKVEWCACVSIRCANVADGVKRDWDKACLCSVLNLRSSNQRHNVNDDDVDDKNDVDDARCVINIRVSVQPISAHTLLARPFDKGYRRNFAKRIHFLVYMCRANLTWISTLHLYEQIFIRFV